MINWHDEFWRGGVCDDIARPPEEWMEMNADGAVVGDTVPTTARRLRRYTAEEVAGRAAQKALRDLEEHMWEDDELNYDELSSVGDWPDIEEGITAAVAVALLPWARRCNPTILVDTGEDVAIEDSEWDWSTFGLTVEGGVVVGVEEMG